MLDNYAHTNISEKIFQKYNQNVNKFGSRSCNTKRQLLICVMHSSSDHTLLLGRDLDTFWIRVWINYARRLTLAKLHVAAIFFVC